MHSLLFANLPYIPSYSPFCFITRSNALQVSSPVNVGVLKKTAKDPLKNKGGQLVEQVLKI